MIHPWHNFSKLGKVNTRLLEARIPDIYGLQICEFTVLYLVLTSTTLRSMTALMNNF